MCYWYLDHGRCGHDFPRSKNEFLFIPDDFVTHPSSASAKKRCLQRPPSPKVDAPVQDDNLYDDSYYET